MGRPTRFKQDIIRQIKVLAAFDFTWGEIAHVLDVRPETISRWKRKHPEMDYVFAQGKSELKSLIASGYIKELKAGNWDAIKEGLKKKLGWKDDPLVDASQHEHITIIVDPKAAEELKLRNELHPELQAE